MKVVVRTGDCPVAERFAFWREVVHRAFVPVEVRSDHGADFRASARLVDLGGVRVAALTYPPLEARRTARLIRRSDPESYQVMLTVRGRHRLVRGGREAAGGPGDLVLCDASRPWHGWADAEDGTVAGVLVQFPRALLPLPADRVGRLTAVPLPGRDGIGPLVTRHLLELVRHADRYRAADAARLAAPTVDLLAALLAHHLDTDAALPPETQQRVLLARIQAFIRQRLGSPDLTPPAIAAAHQISLRSLHRLFHDQGLTVAGWIRHRRLERCRRDLADPGLFSRPVHAVAARWGFPDPAHFSRAFRAAYGMPPGDYRHLARHGHRWRASSTTGRASSTTS